MFYRKEYLIILTFSWFSAFRNGSHFVRCSWCLHSCNKKLDECERVGRLKFKELSKKFSAQMSFTDQKLSYVDGVIVIIVNFHIFISFRTTSPISSQHPEIWNIFMAFKILFDLSNNLFTNYLWVKRIRMLDLHCNMIMEDIIHCYTYLLETAHPIFIGGFGSNFIQMIGGFEHRPFVDATPLNPLFRFCSILSIEHSVATFFKGRWW